MSASTQQPRRADTGEPGNPGLFTGPVHTGPQVSLVAPMDTELRFKIGVHESSGVFGAGPAVVVTNCGACGQRVTHHLPFAEAARYADEHATPGSSVACSTLGTPTPRALAVAALANVSLRELDELGGFPPSSPTRR